MSEKAIARRPVGPVGSREDVGENTIPTKTPTRRACPTRARRRQKSSSFRLGATGRPGRRRGPRRASGAASIRIASANKVAAPSERTQAGDGQGVGRTRIARGRGPGEVAAGSLLEEKDRRALVRKPHDATLSLVGRPEGSQLFEGSASPGALSRPGHDVRRCQWLIAMTGTAKTAPAKT